MNGELNGHTPEFVEIGLTPYSDLTALQKAVLLNGNPAMLAQISEGVAESYPPNRSIAEIVLARLVNAYPTALKHDSSMREMAERLDMVIEESYRQSSLKVVG